MILPQKSTEGFFRMYCLTEYTGMRPGEMC
jgi:hypothetical protein